MCTAKWAAPPSRPPALPLRRARWSNNSATRSLPDSSSPASGNQASGETKSTPHTRTHHRHVSLTWISPIVDAPLHRERGARRSSRARPVAACGRLDSVPREHQQADQNLIQMFTPYISCLHGLTVADGFHLHTSCRTAGLPTRDSSSRLLAASCSNATGALESLHLVSRCDWNSAFLVWIHQTHSRAARPPLQETVRRSAALNLCERGRDSTSTIELQLTCSTAC